MFRILISLAILAILVGFAPQVEAGTTCVQLQHVVSAVLQDNGHWRSQRPSEVVASYNGMTMALLTRWNPGTNRNTVLMVGEWLTVQKCSRSAPADTQVAPRSTPRPATGFLCLAGPSGLVCPPRTR